MRVLVADDDGGSRLVAKAVVEDAGHECFVAEDGTAAWKLYQEHRPNVLVTDLMMPGLDGLALCRAIRAAESDSYTYLVLLTSHGARADVLAGMEAGADDYVTKPLDPFTLQTRLLAADRVTSLHAELAGYRRALAAQARTDPLTGLRNRLTMADDLELLDSSSERYGHDYCLAMCDIDDFKSYNDLYGHQAGDAAIKAVAAALASERRESDALYRYGGEEFLLVLPNQSSTGAAAALDRARAAVFGLGIPHSGSSTGVLTISTGISANTEGHRVGGERLIHEADDAMYAAKAMGRNAVVVSAAILHA
ncbi:MAG TPA: diguanylate cyclase [Microbacteriaceae bacterium]|jgi:diguanylate cyclase (GGDEF)-like protein|nr:diguanylate cyclase [Microbacteriaceae bacterium]